MKAMKINLQAQRKTCIESNLDPKRNDQKHKNSLMNSSGQTGTVETDE